MMYTFDVETSYKDGVAWVWSWGLCDENLHTEHGNGVNWLRPILELPDGAEVWIHNLPFDGEFVFWALIEKGWKITYSDDRDRKHGWFTPRIDTNGMVSMVIHNRGNRITLRDSNRIFRCKLAQLPKLCGFSGEVVKLEMDYDEIREPNHTATPQEVAYQLADVVILMKAMKWLRRFAPTGNTIGSIALNDWKEFMGSSPFTPLTVDERMQFNSLYSGGVVFTPPTNKRLSVKGRVYDRNSMYSAEACGSLPIRVRQKLNTRPPRFFFEGQWGVHAIAKGVSLKPGGFPTIITPYTGAARSHIDIIDKWFFSFEFEYILRNYQIEEYEIIQSIEFETAPVCREFVEKWYAVKCLNDERRNFAKFVLNNLTGKFGEWDVHELYQRELVGGGYISKRINETRATPNKWAFMPAVAFITSRSRLALAEAAQKSGVENLLYTDTDSVHTTGELPADMVDEVRLGAWKKEFEFNECCYIKPKSYWERNDTETVKRHAGLNSDATLAKEIDRKHGVFVDTGELISPDNMKPGSFFYSRVARKVRGGVIINREVKRL